MTWSDKQILDILRMIEASEYDEVRIETTDFKLHVRRSGAPSVGTLGAAAPGTATSTPTFAPTAADAASTPRSSPGATPAAEPAVTEEATAPVGIVVIRAPMIGTFYRAPSPQSPPFVTAGGTVKSGDTVCLIEVMKLFNTIKAETDGKVVRILAQNAATVRKDEPLLWIEPATRLTDLPA